MEPQLHTYGIHGKLHRTLAYLVYIHNLLTVRLSDLTNDGTPSTHELFLSTPNLASVERHMRPAPPCVAHCVGRHALLRHMHWHHPHLTSPQKSLFDIILIISLSANFIHVKGISLSNDWN